MSVDGTTLLAILGMAAITYLTRIGGFWLVGRMQPGPRLAAALEAVPGSVLIAVIAPAVLATGVAETIAAAITVLAALRLPLIGVVAVGVISAAALRFLLS